MWKTILHSIFPPNPQQKLIFSISVNVNSILRVDQGNKLELILEISLFHSLYPIYQQKWLALSVKLYLESNHFSPNLPSWFKLPSLYTITVIF